MRRRVESLLRIWEAEGVVVERHGLQIVILGLDRPDWFDDWVERNFPALFSLLPDLDVDPAPSPEPIRVDLPENRRWAYNELGVDSGGRERPPEPVLPRDRTVALLQALQEYAEL